MVMFRIDSCNVEFDGVESVAFVKTPATVANVVRFFPSPKVAVEVILLVFRIDSCDVAFDDVELIDSIKTPATVADVVKFLPSPRVTVPFVVPEESVKLRRLVLVVLPPACSALVDVAVSV